MPTLTRILVTLASLAVFAWGAMLVLATFVEPKQTRMTIEVPLPGLAGGSGGEGGG
jgi:hypothetical protein